MRTMMSAMSAVFCYDLNGNMTQRIEGSDTYTFTYDTENRLVTGAKNGVTLASYTYDGDGKRVKAQEGGFTTYYIGDYYEWREGPTTTAVKYYYAAGQRIAMRKAGTLTWLLGDHLGSTTITANENGTLASEQTYTAWGQTRSGSVTTDRQYTGQISESQLGIYFYNARFYDSTLGRFISPDTLIPNAGKPADWDRYTYASNSPIVYSDPNGHCYNRDSNGNLTARCQAYWERYTQTIDTLLKSDAFLLADEWQGPADDTHTKAHGKAAQDKYLEVLNFSGKGKISSQELLSTVAFNEFGTLTGSDYLLAEEALGRQWYFWCGSDGICTGDQIWQFLGSLEGWYNKPADRIIDGLSISTGNATAQRINSTESWKNGPQAGRPFAFGNLSMYPNARNEIILAEQGWGQAQSAVLMVNQLDPFVVWTPEQRDHWLKVEHSSP